MSRTSSLFDRLDLLDRSFLHLLEKQLRLLSDRGYSVYVERCRDNALFARRSWRDPKTKEIEDIEKELRALCTKLKVDIRDTNLHILEKLLARTQTWNQRRNGQVTKVARELLEESKSRPSQAIQRTAGRSDA